MSREIADESGDFRDEIDFRLEAEEISHKERRKADQTVNAKKGIRLPPDVVFYLTGEILTTNKTDVAIARKFGVCPSAVCRRRHRLFLSLSRRGAKILYRKDGTLFFAS